jgi:hypothetical protein
MTAPVDASFFAVNTPSRRRGEAFMCNKAPQPLEFLGRSGVVDDDAFVYSVEGYNGRMEGSYGRVAIGI